MIVLEWERHKETIVLSGLAHDQDPGPSTLNHGHSCGIPKKLLIHCGHAETSGSRVSLPELPSNLRASVLCFRKKENFWKRGFVKAFYVFRSFAYLFQVYPQRCSKKKQPQPLTHNIEKLVLNLCS